MICVFVKKPEKIPPKINVEKKICPPRNVQQLSVRRNRVFKHQKKGFLVVKIGKFCHHINSTIVFFKSISGTSKLTLVFIVIIIQIQFRRFATFVQQIISNLRHILFVFMVNLGHFCINKIYQRIPVIILFNLMCDMLNSHKYYGHSEIKCPRIYLKRQPHGECVVPALSQLLLEIT